jgi:hypothetical protein
MVGIAVVAGLTSEEIVVTDGPNGAIQAFGALFWNSLEFNDRDFPQTLS